MELLGRTKRTQEVTSISRASQRVSRLDTKTMTHKMEKNEKKTPDIKIKIFCSAKDLANEMTNGKHCKKVSTNQQSNKGLSQIYKEYSKLNVKKQSH